MALSLSTRTHLGLKTPTRHRYTCKHALAQDRTAQLLGLDETLQRLGPGGVAALVAEAEALRKQLEEARAATERAAAEAAANGAAYRRAAANAELRARELQVCVRMCAGVCVCVCVCERGWGCGAYALVWERPGPGAADGLGQLGMCVCVCAR